MTALSPHFSLEEMVQSQYAERHGILNEPTDEIIERLRSTASQLEMVRGLLGQPLIISSGYRSPELNSALGGVSKSAHCKGDAVDFICPAYGNPLKICRAVAAAQIGFDQLIQEGTWVHISFAIPMRHELLTAKFNEGVATYSVGVK